MTSRERIIAAVKNQVPDCVPAVPDISNMIPCRLTGLPFWDIYLHKKPTLYRAYSDAVEALGFDGWFDMGQLSWKWHHTPQVSTVSSYNDLKDRYTAAAAIHTPAGELHTETIFYRQDPPTLLRKMIKDMERDYAAVKFTLENEIIGFHDADIDEKRALAGERGVFCLGCAYPGFHKWSDWFDGSLQEAVYAYCDYPEMFDEISYLMDKQECRKAELILSLKPDLFLLHGSGTLTLSKPEWIEKFSMPTIRKLTKMAKEAGIPSVLHSCGKSRIFVDMLAQTDLSCVNPLEVPPMGDANLREIKQKYGHKLALMGNLHTTQTMLMGSVDDVRSACMQAIDDAGENGGFVLATGDQCGRDTPLENIRAMVETARTYGRY